MKCAVCRTRNSTGPCVECGILLCDECAISCAACGRRICPGHARKTAGLGSLCAICSSDAAAAKGQSHTDRYEAERHHVATIKPGPAAQQAGASRPTYEGPRPWQVAVFYACLGAMFTAILLLFPDLGRLPLWPGASFVTPYVVICVPILGLIWALVGIVLRKRDGKQAWCYFSVAIALVSIVIIVLAVRHSV